MLIRRGPSPKAVDPLRPAQGCRRIRLVAELLFYPVDLTSPPEGCLIVFCRQWNGQRSATPTLHHDFDAERSRFQVSNTNMQGGSLSARKFGITSDGIYFSYRPAISRSPRSWSASLKAADHLLQGLPTSPPTREAGNSCRSGPPGTRLRKPSPSRGFWSTARHTPGSRHWKSFRVNSSERQYRPLFRQPRQPEFTTEKAAERRASE